MGSIVKTLLIFGGLNAFYPILGNCQEVEDDCPQCDCLDENGTWPIFPGGEKAIEAFLNENLQYPEKALRDSIEGVVYVNYVIDTTGEIIDIKIVRSLNEIFDAEALRLVESLPNYSEPGIQWGKPRQFNYTIPVRFKLPD